MDNFGTTQFGPGPGYSSPAVSPGASGPGPSRRGGRSRIIRWAAGIGAAALLAGGGIGAARGIGSGPAPASTAQLTSSLQLTSAEVQAAVPELARDTNPASLRTCLARARALAQGGNITAARQARRACLAGLRLAFRLRGEHGTVTIQTKSGPVALVWERGLVTSAPGSGTTFTVTAKDNTAWTWTVTGKTRVRQGGKTVTPGDLALNSQVFVFGRVAGGADTAVIVRIAR